MGKWGSWTRRPTSPATIVPMSLQPAIPSWVALQQSPCPLRRLLTASRSILLLYSQQQQTVTCPYLRCLNTGVHSRLRLSCFSPAFLVLLFSNTELPDCQRLSLD